MLVVGESSPTGAAVTVYSLRNGSTSEAELKSASLIKDALPSMLHRTLQCPRSQVSMRTRIEEEMTKAYALSPPARSRYSLAWPQNGAHARRGRPLAGLALARFATVALVRGRVMFECAGAVGVLRVYRAGA